MFSELRPNRMRAVSLIASALADALALSCTLLIKDPEKIGRQSPRGRVHSRQDESAAEQLAPPPSTGTGCSARDRESPATPCYLFLLIALHSRNARSPHIS
ncbi:hypothetical protein B0J12DRAFT_670746 [Macrophomina phaseolina]|uniref:Secreted protein n=1 Tax=Macrophomina phaseolina TaxID=35725 RepID=A0ABQ8G4M2_9PEZI|nr:hypothetical protein B0J12DRAFT_670746 [Macrophomina phaseolina]